MKDQDPEQNDPYKFYFQIDTEWIKKYMNSLINKIDPTINKDVLDKALNNLYDNDIPLLSQGFSPIVLPVNSWISSIVEDKTSLCLGNNCYNEGIWKMKYFVYNKLQKEYELHLQSYARHFISQPNHYRGLYDILN